MKRLKHSLVYFRAAALISSPFLHSLCKFVSSHAHFPTFSFPFFPADASGSKARSVGGLRVNESLQHGRLEIIR